ncbi:DNA phosphorothioation-associated putative methyltransferase [Rheinheimera mesophila]|uniref:DNA phosphorothioation-associated putative methyltransferase n=1 Tax=Rheinheimera mesophila TaxID=1547515 RepID=A0A3P3QJI1_9GAMM|nr:DNA phosphorothioation-associated putative methyltransferase [Rheinheimera mesophila]RRJ21326.1 DNA phosphorothioation-associated putative methyltransferase [Rheinheimera mesophila]
MLTADIFRQWVLQLPYKKELPQAIYLHKDTLEQTHKPLHKVITAISNALKIVPEQWNVVKLSKTQFQLALLDYPNFYDVPYPELKQSINIDLAKLSHRVLHYDIEQNPPILHRKELMLSPDHSRYKEYKDITIEAEQAGLYEFVNQIGFRDSWIRLIAKKGYVLVDGRLFRESTLPIEEQHKVDRYRTALMRRDLSLPFKLLEKNDFLVSEYSFFDYGCGRGDDLTELLERGLNAFGWDPNFRPDNECQTADIVNLGYVINVIEDLDERIEALLNAWQLSEKLLVVSAMLANDDFIARFKSFKDGVLTSRNTFQKYYQQAELKGFIERTLDELPVAIAPGVFIVFRDKELEQLFLSSKQRRRSAIPERIHKTDKKQQLGSLYLQHQQSFDELWLRCLDLGRLPAETEYAKLELTIQLAGSARVLQRWLSQIFDATQLELAAAQRKQDLLVYFALNLFEKRQQYRNMPVRIQNDVREFFGTFKVIEQQATTLLRSIAQPILIEQSCLHAHQQLPASQLNEAHSLVLHKNYLQQLPALLRVYVGAALQLYGDLTDIDLIKIHITSGKVSLMGYDDFSKDIPLLKERIKIKMAEQKVDFFDYLDEWKMPPLLNKEQLVAKLEATT